jgi:hypothetical protein
LSAWLPSQEWHVENSSSKLYTECVAQLLTCFSLKRYCEEMIESQRYPFQFQFPLEGQKKNRGGEVYKRSWNLSFTTTSIWLVLPHLASRCTPLLFLFSPNNLHHNWEESYMKFICLDKWSDNLKFISTYKSHNCFPNY